LPIVKVQLILLDYYLFYQSRP